MKARSLGFALLFWSASWMWNADVVGQVEDPVKTIIDSCQPRLVKIFGASAGRVTGYATGLVVSDDGSIITTQGVLLDGQQVRVVDHRGVEHQASVIRRDRVKQLALLKIPVATPDHFEILEQDAGEKGDWVVAVCNAFKVADKSEPISATLGVISLRTSIEAMLNRRDVAYRGDLVLIDAIVSNPGAGGGAVVTLDGRLVGMVGKIINSSDTNTRLNYAVPTSTLARFLQGTAGQTVSAPAGPRKSAYLGIKLFKLGGRNSPAYIDRVVKGSPAAAADLKPDDLIVSVGGTKIGTVKQYEQVLADLDPEQEVVLVLKRGDELIRQIVQPEARK